MSDLLLYQTSDPRFADRVVEALTAAGIPCSQAGRGYVEMNPAIYRDLGNGIGIFIADRADYPRANQILIELGAAIETPPQVPSRRLLVILAAIFTALAFYIAVGWK
jgi:hypothetical protein